jgi:hypothetical protein
MIDANEEAEESVHSGNDCDNEVLPPKKRGTKLNYALDFVEVTKEILMQGKF